MIARKILGDKTQDAIIPAHTISGVVFLLFSSWKNWFFHGESSKQTVGKSVGKKDGFDVLLHAGERKTYVNIPGRRRWRERRRRRGRRGWNFTIHTRCW